MPSITTSRLSDSPALQKPQFLTIQKVVKLMSPFHKAEFCEYLREIKAIVPLRLVEAIDDSVVNPVSSDELCEAVYGKSDAQTRKSFNQLASHTFKLTAYLSRNYPSYLVHNVCKVEEWINAARIREANILADILLDIAEKIEDFQTQQLVLRFFSQQAHLQKSHAEVVRYTAKLVEASEYELVYNQINLYLRKNFNISVKDDSVLHSLDSHFQYFKSFHEHPSAKVRILSKFANFYLYYYYRPTEFLTERIQQELEEFDEEFHKYGVVTFPFMEDIYSKIMFYRLNLSTTDLSSKEGKSEYQKLLVHNRFLKFWQNYVNVPELYAITIKSTYYLTRYHSINHRQDFRQVIPAEDKQEIARLAARCEELISKDIWEPDHVSDLIHFRLAWSALLLLGERTEVRKGVDNLEKLMTTFQQITFSESMDSIFICLMIGYFAVDDYKACVDTFKRYTKLSKGRVVYAENDLEIHSYYYVAQWLSSQRQQYLRKIEENYRKAGQHSSSKVIQQTILELVNYFNIPVSLT
jgi:hypothetical protein